MPDGRVALRHDDLERTRRANAERLLHLRVTDPGAVLGGDDLESRAFPSSGRLVAVRAARGSGSPRVRRGGGVARAARPSGRSATSVLARVHPSERQRVHPRAEPSEHGRQQGQRRGQDEDDAEHAPTPSSSSIASTASTAIRIGRRSLHIARQSVLAGIALSLIAMGFAAAGYLPPVQGALLQGRIDVAVIVNALRALTD